MKSFAQLQEDLAVKKKKASKVPAKMPGEKEVMKLIVPMSPTIDNVSSTMVGDQINQA
jgi:hypothetical protein